MPSELDLIERIAAIVTQRSGVAIGLGDDAAVLDGDPPTVVALDIVVDGVHFRRSTSAPSDIGHRALAVNLSDLAAMGARPVAAFVGLCLPANDPLTSDTIEDVYRGMEALAGRYGVTIAGGDITTAPALALSVTVVGHMADGVAPVRRRGAQPGDAVCVTGTLGAAAAGIRILDEPLLATGNPSADALRDAARRPDPRVAAGQALARLGVTAMLDCSDGLALDARRLADASSVHIDIDLERLPLAEGVATLAAAAGVDADVLAATGGDDYELVVTLPAGSLARAQAASDVPLSPIGRVSIGSPGVTLRRNGEVVTPPTLGWEHHTP